MRALKSTGLAEWSRVDAYLATKLCVPAGIVAAEAHSSASGLRPIHVPHSLGLLLRQLARGARNVVEVGTLAGVSALWLCDGGKRKVTTLEVSERNAAVALENIARSGMEQHVKVLVGDAVSLLPSLPAKQFDFMFVDANKDRNAVYVRLGVEHLLAAGGSIVVDNVVREGAVVDSAGPMAVGTREMFDYLATQGDQDVTWTVLQTVGSKGHDGFCVIQLKD